MSSVPAAISVQPSSDLSVNDSRRRTKAGISVKRTLSLSIDDLCPLADLQRVIVAQPGRARREVGQDQKQPAFLLISDRPLWVWMRRTIPHA